MTDRSTRSLSRQAATDPGQRAALLVARLRDGSLSRERLVFCAYLGDEAARAVEEWAPDDGLHHGPIYMDSDDQCSGSRLLAVCCYCAELPEFLTGLFSLPLDGLPQREERCEKCGGQGTVEWSPKVRAQRAVMPMKFDCRECEASGIRPVPWPPAEYVALMAAVAAGWVALKKFGLDPAVVAECRAIYPCDACPCRYHSAKRALSAAEHYLDVGTLEAREAWRRVCPGQGRSQADPPNDWLVYCGESVDLTVGTTIPAAARALGGECEDCGGDGSQFTGCERCHGYGTPGEDAVRKTIGEKLIEWCLAEESQEKL